MNKWLIKSIFAIQLFILASTTFVNTAFITSAVAEDNKEFLQLGCSDWKPYCYKYNDQLRGPLIDISQKIMDDAGFDYTINIFPWSRVYNLGLKQENFLVLGLGRTTKRENIFKWIAPLKQPSQIKAYRSSNRQIKIDNKSDLKNYRVAVERGSYTHDYMLERGHDEEKLIVVSRYSQLFNVVLFDRADLLLIDSKALQPELVRNGFDKNAFEPAILAFTVTEYLATGLSTSDEIVKRLKASYDKLISENKINLPQ